MGDSNAGVVNVEQGYNGSKGSGASWQKIDGTVIEAGRRTMDRRGQCQM